MRYSVSLGVSGAFVVLYLNFQRVSSRFYPCFKENLPFRFNFGGLMARSRLFFFHSKCVPENLPKEAHLVSLGSRIR